MSTRRATGALMLCVCAIFLVGCTSQVGDEIAALSRTQTPEDQLPQDLLSNENLNIKLDTTRLLADHEGVRYFASRSKDEDRVCFMVYRSTQSWVSSCSDSLPMEMGMLGARDAVLIGSSPLTPGDWTVIADNVAIRK